MKINIRACAELSKTPCIKLMFSAWNILIFNRTFLILFCTLICVVNLILNVSDLFPDLGILEHKSIY